MTFEKMCFVSPEDILSVQFECTNCGAATTIPVDKLENGDIGIVLTNNCRHCRTPTGLAINTKELAELIDFNLLLGKLSKTLKGRGIKLSFKVECPKGETHV